MSKDIMNRKKYSHKGDNGRLLVIGGSEKYHGAPLFSILSARRFVDLIYFYPAVKVKQEELISVIKNKVTEVIILKKLSDRDFKKIDVVLFGIGTNKKNTKLDVNINSKQFKNKRLVIDGGGLDFIKGEIPFNSIITPHETEFIELFGMEGNKQNVKKMARENNCIILKKDSHGDIISDGKTIKIIKGGNVGLTKGGTGDVLSGLTAALFCKNSAINSCIIASKIIKNSANKLEKTFGYNYCTSDLIEELARVR